MARSNNPEHLEEDEDDQHDDHSKSDATRVHVFSCIYCATGLHDQCRGTEEYKGLPIRCECSDSGHAVNE